MRSAILKIVVGCMIGFHTDALAIGPLCAVTPSLVSVSSCNNARLDEDEDTEALMGAAREPDALDTFRLLVAPLFPPSRATKSDGKKGAAARQPSVPAQPPKALLQMLCRHEGWIAPRYEKVVEVTPGSKPGAKYLKRETRNDNLRSAERDGDEGRGAATRARDVPRRARRLATDA